MQSWEMRTKMRGIRNVAAFLQSSNVFADFISVLFPRQWKKKLILNAHVSKTTIFFFSLAFGIEEKENATHQRLILPP